MSTTLVFCRIVASEVFLLASKRINLILIGAGDKDETYGQLYEAKFIGGKKNDLVIVYGGGSKTNAASWAYCFGWTEKDLVKRNLETILLSNPINNNILDKMESEIRFHYQIKDWTKFNYITVYPPTWVYFVYLILMSQIHIFFCLFTNTLPGRRKGIKYVEK